MNETSASNSLPLTLRANIVVTILKETANDISQCKPTTQGTASSRREATISMAISFLKWSEQHSGETLVFAKSFQDFLAPCLFEKGGVGNPSWRGRKLHDIQGSPAYGNLWKVLPFTVSTNDPMFQQMILTGVLERLIKILFPVAECADEARPEAIISLSETDEKVIRYIAGYIPVSLRRKLERSSNPYKEGFIVCLWSMCEDDLD